MFGRIILWLIPAAAAFFSLWSYNMSKTTASLIITIIFFAFYPTAFFIRGFFSYFGETKLSLLKLVSRSEDYSGKHTEYLYGGIRRFVSANDEFAAYKFIRPEQNPNLVIPLCMLSKKGIVIIHVLDGTGSLLPNGALAIGNPAGNSGLTLNSTARMVNVGRISDTSAIFGESAGSNITLGVEFFKEALEKMNCDAKIYEIAVSLSRSLNLNEYKKTATNMTFVQSGKELLSALENIVNNNSNTLSMEQAAMLNNYIVGREFECSTTLEIN